VLSNLTGLPIFLFISKDPVWQEEFVLQQNLAALPIHNSLVFGVAFIQSLASRGSRTVVLWSVAGLCILLSMVRSLAVVYIVYVVLGCLLCLAFKAAPSTLRLTVAVFGITLVALSCALLFPHHVDALLEKSGLGEGVAGVIESSGTFGFRLKLIQKAYDAVMENKSLLLGLGYTRFSEPGQYDFVMGGDTHVPTILYTEGLAGFAFRLAPVLLLFYRNVAYLLTHPSGRYRLYSIVAVMLITAEFINVVQTTIHAHYHITMLALFLLELIKLNDAEAATSS
jgi:hypothetical protein